MRNRLLTTTIVLTLLLALASLPAFAGTKVDVCHIPPGDPYNFHTISVSENAVAAHLGHGDYDIACHDVACTSLCDDFDACTQDVESDLEQCICNPEPRPAVDCNDSNPCTLDACTSEFGCTYDTAALNGTLCDDADPDTSDDVCTDGVCAGTPSFDPCNPNLCQNGGICIDLGDGGFICNCADGWGGDLCEISNCCFAWGGLGCGVDWCEDRVCNLLPECCTVGWVGECPSFSANGAGSNCYPLCGS